MPDSSLLVKTYLLQDAALISMLGPFKVKAGDLPAKFNPENGACVTVCAEGGQSHPENPTVKDRIKIRIWAGVDQYSLAHKIYEQVWLWLHGKNGINLPPDGFIIVSQESARGSDLTDPDTGWATVVTFYEITSRD